MRKLCELSIGERLVKPALPQRGEHVAAQDLFLVDFRLFFLRLGRLLELRLFLSIVDGSPVLLQNFQDLTPIMPPCKRSRCLPALVLMVQVDTLLDEEFDHLDTSVLDRVVDRCVPILVDDVHLTARIDQLPRRGKVSLADTVKNRVLPIDVHVVHVSTLGQQKVNYLRVPLPDSVVERQLIQFVLLVGVHALFYQEFDEDFSLLLYFHRTGLEQRRLIKVLRIVEHR